jgi:hypothetical protein
MAGGDCTPPRSLVSNGTAKRNTEMIPQPPVTRPQLKGPWTGAVAVRRIAGIMAPVELAASTGRRTARRRRVLLLACSICALLLFSRLPGYRDWAYAVVKYYRQVPRHLATRDYDKRMYDRLGANYSVPMQIKNSSFLRAGDVLLLPPIDYVSRTFGSAFSMWAEPKFFYYMAGRARTVTLDSVDLREATCTVMIGEDQGVELVRFESPRDLERAIQTFSMGQR